MQAHTAAGDRSRHSTDVRTQYAARYSGVWPRRVFACSAGGGVAPTSSFTTYSPVSIVIRTRTKRARTRRTRGKKSRGCHSDCSSQGRTHGQGHKPVELLYSQRHRSAGRYLEQQKGATKQAFATRLQQWIFQGRGQVGLAWSAASRCKYVHY